MSKAILFILKDIMALLVSPPSAVPTIWSNFREQYPQGFFATASIRALGPYLISTHRFGLAERQAPYERAPRVGNHLTVQVSYGASARYGPRRTKLERHQAWAATSAEAVTPNPQ